MGTIKNPTRTKRFQALLAVAGGDEAKAVAAWNATNPESPIAAKASTVVVDPQIAELVKAGYSEADAKAAIEALSAEPAKVEAPEAKPLTSHEIADAAVAKAGLVHFRGRVYSTPDLIEAQVRVLKTGKPEVVLNSGETKTKGTVVYRTDEGTSVVLQNLGVAS
jgi:hypothetical protein